MKLLLLGVRIINFLLSDFGYRLGHLIYGLIYCLNKYTYTRTILWLLVYFLSLELLIEKFIFTQEKRRKLNQQGKEIIEELMKEIEPKK